MTCAILIAPCWACPEEAELPMNMDWSTDNAKWFMPPRARRSSAMTVSFGGSIHAPAQSPGNRKRAFVCGGAASAHHTDFAQIALHAAMDVGDARRGAERVLRQGFRALIEPLHQRRMAPVQRLGDPMRERFIERLACADVTPRTDRMDQFVLPLIRTGRNVDGLEKAVLGAHALDLLFGEADQTTAVLEHRRKARPADAGAPQRGDAAIRDHHGPVACLIEIDRLKILLAVEAKTIGHITAQQGDARGARAPRD